jgi:hypothetical protein
MSGRDVKISATSASSNDVTIGDVSTLLNDILTNIEQKKETNEIIINDNTVIPTNKKRKAVPENVSAKSTKVNSSLNFNSILGGLFTNANNLLDKFKGHYETLNDSYNNIINGTRNALTTAENALTIAANDAKEVAIPIIKSIHEDINNIHEQGLIALSDAYTVYLQAMKITEDVKEGLGFQTIDTIILEHEKMAYIALLELVFEKQKELINSTTSDEDIKTLIEEAMEPDGNYRDKQEQVRTHIVMAVKIYFIFKHGKSAVEDMSIIASKGIYNAKGELLFVPRNTSEMMGKYVKEDLDSRITTILNNKDERNYFLKEIVDNILTTPGTEPSIDHSKYYGKPSTPNDFINNIFSHIGTRINSLNASFDFYKRFINDKKKTGDTIYSALNKLKSDLQTLKDDLLKQHLKFKGEYVNTLINDRSSQLQTKINELKNEMDAHLQEIASRKADGMESSGGKKTRRRKATSSRRVSLRKRKSKRDKRSNQSKGTLKKKHSKKHKA